MLLYVTIIISSIYTFPGVLDAITKHKANLRQSYISKRFVKPFLGACGVRELDDKGIDQAFVELAIIKGKSVDEKFLNSNRDYHLQQVQLEKEMVTLDELLHKNDRFTMISGIPGIGKSTLVKKLVLDWEKGALLSGKENTPNVRLLFPILCRELNTMEVGEEETAVDILKRLYPDFFGDWKMVKELSENLLFLVDGVDELRNIDEIRSIDGKKRQSPFNNLLYQLMNPDFLTNHKCIFVGRPRTVRMLRSFFNHTFCYESKKVEVCGFSPDSVTKYVMKQFEDDRQLGEDILLKIRSSPITDGLSRIPLHAWVLTSIIKDNPFIEIPGTATELLLYSFLVFVRRQKEKEGIGATVWNLTRIAEDQETMNQVLTIAKYSYETLRRSEIIFEADGVDDGLFLEIEKMGLLVKSTKRETEITIYQFQHLTFQELFAAIHIFRMREEVDAGIFQDSILQACLTIAAGLEGIVHGQTTKSNAILQGFLRKMLFSNEKVSGQKSVLGLLQTSWVNTLQITGAVVQIDISDLFIEGLFESQSLVFPVEMPLPENAIIRFFKENNSAPLTKYPLFRFCYFLHILLQVNPSVRIDFFPLLSVSFGIKKFQDILLKIKNLYVNAKQLVQEELIQILSFIFERMYPCLHFNQLAFNFKFANMDRFVLDSFTSLFRFESNLEGLHLRCVELADKPKLTWSRSLALLRQSIMQHRNLQNLTLSKCSLTDEIFADVTDILEILTGLDVSYNSLTQVTLNRILESLKEKSKLETLNFSWNYCQKQPNTHTESNGNNSPEPCSTNHAVNIVDISVCHITSDTLSSAIIQNILKSVLNLRVDKFTPLDSFLTTAKTMKEQGLVILTKNIYITGIDDDKYFDYLNELRRDLRDLEITVNDETLAMGGLKAFEDANVKIELNRLPDWFEESF